MSNTVPQCLQVYEHVYETVDINSSPEVRANATAKVKYLLTHRWWPASKGFSKRSSSVQTVLSLSLSLPLRSSGNRGSFRRKRRTFTSPSCRTAQDRRRSRLQHNGWQGAKLTHLHLADHPRRHRWPTRGPEEGRPASLRQRGGMFFSHNHHDDVQFPCWDPDVRSLRPLACIPQSVEGEHHEKAVELLKAAQGTVKLVVRYTPKVLEEMESRFEKMRSAKRRQQNNYPK